MHGLIRTMYPVIPDFGVACRRLTPGPGYLEALCEENVRRSFPWKVYSRKPIYTRSTSFLHLSKQLHQQVSKPRMGITKNWMLLYVPRDLIHPGASLSLSLGEMGSTFLRSSLLIRERTFPWPSTDSQTGSKVWAQTVAWGLARFYC